MHDPNVCAACCCRCRWHRYPNPFFSAIHLAEVIRGVPGPTGDSLRARYDALSATYADLSSTYQGVKALGDIPLP